jgi:hypothetical protein
LKILLNITFLLGCCAVLAQHPFSYSSTSTEAAGKLYGDTIGLDDVEIHGAREGSMEIGGAGSVVFPLLMDMNYFNANAYTKLAFMNAPTFERFKVSQPITDVKYIIGSNKEQYFDVLHAQNMGNVNFSLGLKKVTNEGFYINQNTNNTHVFANANHQGKKYFYSLDFDLDQKLQGLNGGFNDDSLFLIDSLSPSTLYEVNLLNASQQLRQTNYRFLQEFQLSNTNDTITNKKNSSKLVHSIGYQSQSRNFYDTIGSGETSLNSDYYNGFGIDSIVSNDDIKYQRFYSNLSYQYIYNREKKEYKVEAGISPSYNIVKRTAIEDTAVFDLESTLKLVYWDLTPDGPTKHYNVSFNYLVNDKYDNNDYELIGNGFLKGKNYGLSMSLLSRRQRPQLDMLQYAGNSANWNSELGKSTLNHIGFNGSMIHNTGNSSKVTPKIFIDLYDQKNPIIFGYDVKPQQLDGFAQVLSSGASLDFDLATWNIKAKGVYQYQGGYSVFRLPNLYGNVQLAKKFSLFKKKMKLTAGLSVTYFSKYNSRDFDAATGQFFIGSDQEVGSYPYADVFIKGRVQKVTYFIMSSHPHDGLLANNYFTAPGYAANGRMLKVGINWLFLN